MQGSLRGILCTRLGHHSLAFRGVLALSVHVHLGTGLYTKADESLLLKSGEGGGGIADFHLLFG